MGEGTRYAPNRDEIAAKVLDGEAIMINLPKGTYYSLDGVGGRIWELLEDENTAQDIAAVLVREFDVSPTQARADVDRMLAELQAEGVIKPAPDCRPRSPAVAPVATAGVRHPYRKPRFAVYRDMADLLALEPPTPGTDQEELWQGFERTAGK